MADEQLYENSSIYRNRLEEILDKSELKDIENKALRLISFAGHSVQRIQLKLIKSGFRKDLIETVTDKLREYNYLNDEEYAKNWLFSRLKKHPESRNHLLFGLLKQGIDRDLAEKTLSGYIDEETELNCAKRVAEKLLRYNELSDNELEKKLYSRGFSTGIVKEVLKTIRND